MIHVEYIVDLDDQELGVYSNIGADYGIKVGPLWDTSFELII